jgi:hypothetical protein
VNDVLANSEWFAFSAAIAGALWGVSLQADFSTLSMRSKTWRCFLAIIAAIFLGPGLLHTFFKGATGPVATAIMFVTATGALTVVPILFRRVQLLAKTGRLWGLPEDKQ